MVLERFKVNISNKAIIGLLYGLNFLLILVLVLCVLGVFFSEESIAADLNLNTAIPPKNYSIAPSSLSKALATYSAQAGVQMVIDSSLTEGKISGGLTGTYTLDAGFAAILKGSGLEAATDSNNDYFLRKIITPVSDTKNLPLNIELKEVAVKAKRFVQSGPMPGLNLTKEQIPGNVQSLSAKDIKEAHSLSLTDLMNSKLQSVNVNDYQGNPFQMDVTYRGFTASPQLGTAQGLSVFFDGVRVNEPFGDVVNWDMIPMNALEGMEVHPGSNPLFGLNTLGGALTVRSKSGFTTKGLNTEILNGSFGRKQLQVSGGGSKDSLAAFGSLNLFMEDGFRRKSGSEVNQAFGKVEWQGERASLGLSGLAAVNKLIGNGTVPQELYNQDPTAVFTSPDETRNRLMQLQISGAFDVSDTFNITSMAYNRDSNRKSSTGDVIDADTFRGLGVATRRLEAGTTATCAYNDANRDGVPDYYIDRIDPITGSSPFIDKFNASGGTRDYSLLGALNPSIPAANLAFLKQTFSTGYVDNENTSAGNFLSKDTAGSFNYLYSFTETDPATSVNTTYRIVAKPAVNESDCTGINAISKTGGKYVVPLRDANGDIISSRDGAGALLGKGTGIIEGTPTAVITKSNIQQTAQGGNVQFNWNLENHKFMVGASVDANKASYLGTQRFGLIDANRNVYSDPSQIGAEYYAAANDIAINDFNGTQNTRSLYVSETWSPTSTLNFAFSSRYNYTGVETTLAPQKVSGQGSDLATLTNNYDQYAVCPGTDLSSCPIDLSKPVSAAELAARKNGGVTSLDKAATEKFFYHSLNPALGLTWQATPALNLYANWNQGARVPSVIELGCAYDGTEVPFTLTRNGQKVEKIGEYANGTTYGTMPRSLLVGRSCSLPSSLSGDPYLKQIMAQTLEVGARGKFKDLLEWNISAYQTNLRDDIYLVSATPTQNYYQTIGDTLRRGIEFGLAGQYGKSDFRASYAFTEATFQSSFRIASSANSSVLSNRVNNPLYNMIQVSPGDRMPGVPLNNINLSWGYQFTPAFNIRWSLVGHSDAFVRGNENNQHTPGPSQGVYIVDNDGRQQLVASPNYNNNGKTAGYAVLNFRTSYYLGEGWTAGMQINNVLDKTYYSAARLGTNPFAPSVNGAIGPGGFNYNSSEWNNTQFVSAGAPRGIWFSLAYDFDASMKNKLPPSNISMTEPDRTLPPEQLPASVVPSAQELALSKTLDSTPTLPVIRELAKATATARQDAAIAIEIWRQALASNNVEQYLHSYADSFVPENGDRTSWEQAQKLAAISRPNSDVHLEKLMVVPQGKHMSAVFVMRDLSQPANLAVNKMLYMEQQKGRWLIIREHASPLGKNTRAGNEQASQQESEHVEFSDDRLQLQNKQNSVLLASVEATTQKSRRKKAVVKPNSVLIQTAIKQPDSVISTRLSQASNINLQTSLNQISQNKEGL